MEVLFANEAVSGLVNHIESLFELLKLMNAKFSLKRVVITTLGNTHNRIAFVMS